jgi:DNA invertase Pin-like site-specific DNA recombinase
MTANGRLPPGSAVWAYLRVSTDAQADKGLPIQGQREAVERYCTEHGYTLARTYTDEGISAKTDRREQFQRLVADAQSLRPAAIVLWSWSRFSRDQNDALFYKALLRRHGVDLLTVSDEIPRVAGFENVLESLIHWRDEYENKARAEAVKRGAHTLAGLGYLPAGGKSLPRGYKAVAVRVTIGGKDREANRIELDPETAPLVRRAYEMRLAGATMAEIAAACPLYEHADSFGLLFRRTAAKGTYDWRGTAIPVPAIVTPVAARPRRSRPRARWRLLAHQGQRLLPLRPGALRPMWRPHVRPQQRQPWPALSLVPLPHTWLQHPWCPARRHRGRGGIAAAQARAQAALDCRCRRPPARHRW